MFLAPRSTYISDPSLLTPSERPLTTWKLMDQVNPAVAVEKVAGRAPGALSAVTTDKAGQVVGTFVVNESGNVEKQGKVVQ